MDLGRLDWFCHVGASAATFEGSTMMQNLGVSARAGRSIVGRASTFMDVYAKSDSKTSYALFLLLSLDSTVLQQSRAMSAGGCLPGVLVAVLFGCIMVILAHCVIDL